MLKVDGVAELYTFTPLSPGAGQPARCTADPGAVEALALTNQLSADVEQSAAARTVAAALGLRRPSRGRRAQLLAAVPPYGRLPGCPTAADAHPEGSECSRTPWPRVACFSVRSLSCASLRPTVQPDSRLMRLQPAINILRTFALSTS